MIVLFFVASGCASTTEQKIDYSNEERYASLPGASCRLGWQSPINTGNASLKKILIVLALVFGLFQLHQSGQLDAFLGDTGSTQSGSSGQSQLSAQEQELYNTLARIRSKGPYPYQRDGITFENRERLLPNKPKGYYRELTVDTPGLSHRGPRRVVTGGNPPVEFYYTEDHYRSFTRIKGH